MRFNISDQQHNLMRSLGYTIGAIFLYIPANLYPFMTMNHYGQFQDTNIWDGIRTLFDNDMLATALIVFMASIIIPVFKLLSLLFIICANLLSFAPEARTSLLVFIDFIGRWSMLDIFLVSIMVALIKFGSFATVNANTASYLLGCVVILTMLASACLREATES